MTVRVPPDLAELLLLSPHPASRAATATAARVHRRIRTPTSCARSRSPPNRCGRRRISVANRAAPAEGVCPLTAAPAQARPLETRAPARVLSEQDGSGCLGGHDKSEDQR